MMGVMQNLSTAKAIVKFLDEAILYTTYKEVIRLLLKDHETEDYVKLLLAKKTIREIESRHKR